MGPGSRRPWASTGPTALAGWQIDPQVPQLETLIGGSQLVGPVAVRSPGTPGCVASRHAACLDLPQALFSRSVAASVHEVALDAGAQDPALPHASHTGQAEAMQQTPSTQRPPGHSGGDVQALPSALVDAQAPATQ